MAAEMVGPEYSDNTFGLRITNLPSMTTAAGYLKSSPSAVEILFHNFITQAHQYRKIYARFKLPYPSCTVVAQLTPDLMSLEKCILVPFRY